MALSANDIRPMRNPGAVRSYPVAASTTIYAGGLIMINSAGYAVPAAAAASNRGCVGVATKAADNSAGGAAAIDVVVQEGEFLFTGTTLAITANMGLCYAEDDETVDETQGTNEPIAGMVSEYVSATEAWVMVGPQFLT